MRHQSSIDGSGRAMWPHISEWEKCEKRLALSAMPWGPLEWQAVDVESEWLGMSPLANAGDISHHGQPSSMVPDFAASELETFLSSAHQQTGWNQVQSQFGLTGQGQTVAIIDSGIAYNHQALGGGFGTSFRVVGGWDFAENDANPFDDAPAGYHGTHVAGIVGANQGTQQGVAPNVDFVALRVFTDTGQGQMAWVESALQWVYNNRNTFENPITTVNLSLGASWNSSTIPSWATLEDELLKLNQAGIVVVASAGNSFQQNPTPGLAYPAASPYVIPVSSVDPDGNLSGFSQRDSRVIAAPGRNIMSTVPDHFWGADGVFTDWARASGTSMAAPYVSGASVLIREAMELVGMENITVQSIYNTLMNTAVSVFDPITNQSFKSLDLDNAIASIIPADDIGNTLETGRVQNLQSSWRTESWINSLQDQDVMRVNADRSGVLQFDLESEHLDNLKVSLLRNGSVNPLALVNGVASIQVTAGESLGFRIEDGQSIGRYGIDWTFVEAAPSNSGGNGEGAGGGSSVGSPRFGTVTGSTLTIMGTSDADSYELDLRQGIQIRVGDATQTWSTQQIQSIVLDGGLNNDTIKIIGTANADKIELRAGMTLLTTDTLQVEIRNVENVQFDGAGGPDRAFMYDQATDDRLVIHPNRAELIGVGYNFAVENVNRIFVHAVAGGDDQAFVYDSSHNDLLSVRPQFTSISGPNYFNYLAGFERVFAYSTNGGLDRAQVYDSAGDDLFNASPAVTSIVGPGFSTFVRGFSEVEAIANAGGNDRAVIHYTGASQVLSSADSSGVINGSRTSIARHFESVQMSLITAPATSAATSAGMFAEVLNWAGASVTDQSQARDIPDDSLTSGATQASREPMSYPLSVVFAQSGFGQPVDWQHSDWQSSDVRGIAAAEQDGSAGSQWLGGSLQHLEGEVDSAEPIRLDRTAEQLDRLEHVLSLLAGLEEDDASKARTDFFAAYQG